MPEIFLEFLGDASPWLLVLLIPLYFWGKLNYSALKSRESHPSSYQRAVNWLREDSFGLLYLQFLGWLMDSVSRLIGDREHFVQAYATSFQSKGVIGRVFGFNPFTSQSYSLIVFFAFIYPVISFLLVGAYTGDTSFGGAEWFNNVSDNLYVRFFIVFSFFMLVFVSLFFSRSLPVRMNLVFLSGLFFVSAFFYFLVDMGFERSEYSYGVFFILIFVFVLLKVNIVWSLFFSLLIGGVVYYASYFSGGMAIAISFSFVFYIVLILFGGWFFSGFFYGWSGVFFGVLVGCFFGLIGGVIFNVLSLGTSIFYYIGIGFLCLSIIFYLDCRRVFRNDGSVAFWVFYLLCVFVLCILSLSFVSNPRVMLWILFVVSLPLINAPLDWISLGVTRGLFQAMRSGYHRGLGMLFLIVFDLLMAVFLLFSITVVFIAAISVGNLVSGGVFVDVGDVLYGLRKNPSSVDYWWVYFMLLSTLIPTLVHFSLIGGSIALWFPRRLRARLLNNVDCDVYKLFLVWVYLTFVPFLGFILVPVFVLGFLWFLILFNNSYLGWVLLDWAEVWVGVFNRV